MILAGKQFQERDLIERVMRSAQKVKTKGCGIRRGFWVCNHFCVGGAVAQSLCREFGLDPYDMVKK